LSIGFLLFFQKYSKIIAHNVPNIRRFCDCDKRNAWVECCVGAFRRPSNTESRDAV